MVRQKAHLGNEGRIAVATLGTAKFLLANRFNAARGAAPGPGRMA